MNHHFLFLVQSLRGREIIIFFVVTYFSIMIISSCYFLLPRLSKLIRLSFFFIIFCREVTFLSSTADFQPHMVDFSSLKISILIN